MTHTLPISTMAFLPSQERLLDRTNFPLLSKIRLFCISVAIRLISWVEIRQLRSCMKTCVHSDELCDEIIHVLDNSRKIRDTMCDVYKKFDKLDGLYFTKRHLKNALSNWDDLVEDLTASTDMELRALSKELAGLFT